MHNIFSSCVATDGVTLASAATERGLALNGAPNSFLDNLVALAKNALDTTFPPLSADGLRYERTGHLTELEDPLCCAFTDENIRNAAKVAANNMHTARNDALPLIQAAMKDFEQVINPDIPYAYRRRAVTPVAFHPIWQSEFIQDIANSYADGNSAGAMPEGLILSLDDEQYDFVALTKTGLPAVDEMLQSVLATYEVDTLRQIFANAFTYGQLPIVRGMSSLTENWLNDQVLIHVWARNLIDQAPAKSAVNLPAYLAGMGVAIQRTGHSIWSINKVRLSCAENDTLVLGYNGEETFVHSDIYTDWLKRGGSPEIILGASLLQGQVRPVTGKELLAMANVLLSKWNDYVSLTSRSEQERLNAMARVELFKIVRNKIDERDKAGLVACYDDALGRLNEMVERLPTNFIKDPYPHVRDIVLCTFYASMDVPLFIMAMDEIACDDPELSEDEVAALATINYISDWLCKLVTVKSGHR